MTSNVVLIVEDNIDLRRHLRKFVIDNGLYYLEAQNEIEAMNKLNDQVYVIVADIDLSEADGAHDGGIKLARMLSECGSKIPLVLISQTPWHYLPPKGDRKYLEAVSSLGLLDVLDRNESSFWERLREILREPS